MKITEIKLITLELPEDSRTAWHGPGDVYPVVPKQIPQLVRVPGLHRIQYRHGINKDREPIITAPSRRTERFVEVRTDEGITGRVTASTMDEYQVDLVRSMALGEDPLYREHLYQMFHKGTRWLYQTPGWFGDFDNCLWDIAGKAAGLPVHTLIGRVRNSIPCYLTGGDMDLPGYLEHIEAAKSMGIDAYKFHTYKGGKADVPIFYAVREAVGPSFDLINDPVCSYNLREAIEIGRTMEELGFIWLEEPFHEQKMHHYQELCSELDIPVMANEMLMHDLGISTQWLMHGATDLLRANAHHGTTLVLKMAHFAEMYDTSIEMNAAGGLYGHIHATLGCCIDNTTYYEYLSETPDRLRVDGEVWGMTNAPLVVDGNLEPTDLPGWGAEWDEERFQKLVVAER